MVFLPVPAWKVKIESARGGEAGEEELARFTDAVREQRSALDPSCGLDLETGALFSTFRVLAANFASVALVARDVLAAASAAAGVNPGRIAIDVEPISP